MACAARRQGAVFFLFYALVKAKTPWLGTMSGFIANTTTDCWETCRQTGFFCPLFCCQPLDDIGNPSCWDLHGYYTFKRCCLDPAVLMVVSPPEPLTPLKIVIGNVRLPLYRGPSDHNSPRFNERTIEVALGLWFLQRRMASLYAAGGGEVPVEVGNVLASYWPPGDRIFGRMLPWQVLDLMDTGQDATYASFSNASVLSISTIEHIGYDNEGADRAEGVSIGGGLKNLEAWVRGWDAGPMLLKRIMSESSEFLITFPVGFNPHLDVVVSQTPSLSKFARIARRVDALNRWEVDHTGSFAYKYDFRDTYSSEHIGYIYDERLPEIYKRIYGKTMFTPLLLPKHPPFRFANAVCVFTNMEELLA